MHFIQKLVKILSLSMLWCLSFHGVAHAYIDPGTGSAVTSAIIGFFVATGIAIKTYWYKLKALITGKKPKMGEDKPQ